MQGMHRIEDKLVSALGHPGTPPLAEMPAESTFSAEKPTDAAKAVFS